MTSPYRALDFVVVRAPLLPYRVFDLLGDGDAGRHLDDQARAAIAVGSTEFDRALDVDGTQPRSDAALRRYLTRMSTRPTPFGLFAGVGVGEWGARTTLRLAVGDRPRRTRPDAGWLAAFLDLVVAVPAIRTELTVVANTSAWVRAGRVVLAERVGPVESGEPMAVSVRATGVVRRALAAARNPVRYADLVGQLVAGTPGGGPERVTGLLDELCRQSLLLLVLSPPLTRTDRADAALQRLSDIGSAEGPTAQLHAVLLAAARFDAGPATAAGYREVVRIAAGAGPADGAPLQVDSGLALVSRAVTERVAAEAANAAAVLLRLSPTPSGPAHLAGFRRAFEQRYGRHAEVPILDMLDPNTGLGSLPAPAAGRLEARRSAGRNATVLALATAALRDRTRCIDLDAALLRRLETADPATVELPVSLDLAVSVSSPSAAALDRGDFELVVAPTVGSGAAGRMLGRFADLVPGAEGALRRLADEEQTSLPGTVLAELTYAPRSARQANVATRPNLRHYEIAIGLPSGTDPAHTIPVDELRVGVRDGRFRLRWAATGDEVVVTAGHMLNTSRAPEIVRFLADVGRDGVCQLGGFSWGPAAAFPYLPRIRAGRTVLALAQWRLSATDLVGDRGVDRPAAKDIPADLEDFRRLLEDWRRRWAAPARLAVAVGDRRHALDLTRPSDADELRRTLRRTTGPVTLTELYPDVDDLWLEDTAGSRFAAELVVPLIRRTPSLPAPPARPVSTAVADPRPPGSDWLFLKLYTGPDLEDDLLSGPVRTLVADAAALGVRDWFFLRYGDPERHIRLRFHGEPGHLLGTLLPHVTTWAADQLAAGLCRRFAVDTYEREIDRFGGPDGTTAVEAFFAADSAAALSVLAAETAGDNGLDPLALAVLTVDALLAGFGLDVGDRARWCEVRGGPRRESGADYRRSKAQLRPRLAATDLIVAPAPVDLARASIGDAAAALRAALDRLAATGRLAGTPADLLPSLAHLHTNRLIAADHATERRVYGLLGRLCAGLSAEQRPRRAHDAPDLVPRG